MPPYHAQQDFAVHSINTVVPGSTIAERARVLAASEVLVLVDCVVRPMVIAVRDLTTVLQPQQRLVQVRQLPFHRRQTPQLSMLGINVEGRTGLEELCVLQDTCARTAEFGILIAGQREGPVILLVV